MESSFFEKVSFYNIYFYCKIFSTFFEVSTDRSIGSIKQNTSNRERLCAASLASDTAPVPETCARTSCFDPEGKFSHVTAKSIEFLL